MDDNGYSILNGSCCASDNSNLDKNISNNATNSSVDYSDLKAFTTAGIVLGISGFIINFISLLALVNMKPPLQAFHRLLINLAVSDLVISALTCIGAPMFLLYLYQIEEGGGDEPLLCTSRVIMELSYISLLVPVLATTALVVNQYLSVTHPLRYEQFATTRLITFCILGMWIFTFLNGLLIFMSSYLANCMEKEEMTCVRFFEECNYFQIRSLTYSILLLVVTGFTIILYVKMFSAIKQHLTSSSAFQEDSETKAMDRKLHVTIALLFGTVLIFWFPGIIDSFMIIFMSNNEMQCSVCILFHLVANLMFLTNSLCDPFIYGIRLPDVRQGYRRLVKRYLCIGVYSRKRYQKSAYAKNATETETVPVNNTSAI